MQFLRSGEALDLITEWLTPNLISLEHFPFAVALVALLYLGIKGAVPLRDLWVIVPFVLFAFTANRAVPIAGIVLAPWYTKGLMVLPRPSSVASRTQSLVNLAVIVLVLTVPWLLPLEGGLDQDTFAISALEHLGPERAFHDDGVGGYLIYAEWPQRLVYMDDRAELYGDDFVDFVKARAAVPGWDEVFEELDLRQALIKIDDPIGEVLIARGWEERFRDERFLILSAPAN